MVESRMAGQAARLVVAALWAAAVSQAVTLDRYPYLQNVRSDRATVMWTTREAGEGSVQFSVDGGSFRVAAASVRPFLPAETGRSFTYYQYKADLTGLSPNTDYFYRVLVDDEDMTPADPLRFRTAGPGPFTFLAFGDSGADTPAQRQVAQLMLKENPNLVLHTGDIAYESGTFEQFARTYFNYYKDLMKRAPFFTTPGNHDYYINNAAPYLAVHSPPTEGVPPADRGRYYSFDWSNVHFVSLDSNLPLSNAASGTGEMLQWLESDLQKTQQTWRIVFFHHPPYLVSNHEDDRADALVRSNVVPILDRYPIDLVLNGHEHNYQRLVPMRGGRGVDPGFGSVYVITGGGGNVLHPVFPNPIQVYAESTYHFVKVEVQGTRMTLHAIKSDGTEIDNFTLEPRFAVNSNPPQISNNAVVNAASYAPLLAPGTLISIFGTDLAVRANQAAGLPLPTQLSGTDVELNGRRIHLLYVSPTQINAQLPFDFLGQGNLRVSTPAGSSEAPILISSAAPGIFLTSPDPAVVHANGTLVSAGLPAQAGEALSTYLTGLGQVSGPIEAGQPAPRSPLLTTRATVQVQIGGVSVTPSFAGLAPGFVGLYQVNWQVPAGLPSGAVPLQISVSGVSSNLVSLAVR